MELREVKNFLNQIHPVSEEILEDYLGQWVPVEIKRKTAMTRAGEVQKNFYLVLEGYQRSYYLKDGKEHVIAFTYAPGFTGIPESFFSQSPSLYFLETITPSKFLKLSFEKHVELMDRFRPIETLFRKGTEHWLGGLVYRHYELMAHDIETRFRDFVKRSPHLLNAIPHKDLASYLRIDPTNFSKLLTTVRT